MNFQGLSSIGQINIPIHDIDRAVEFYRDSLGMKYLFQVPKMAFFDCQGIRILLGVPENKTDDHPSSIIYFKVEDILAATAALLDRGVVFEGEPHLVAEMPDHDLWMTFFLDPDQNMLALMSEVRRASDSG